jgi:hypothetical protein
VISSPSFPFIVCVTTFGLAQQEGSRRAADAGREAGVRWWRQRGGRRPEGEKVAVGGWPACWPVFVWGVLILLSVDLLLGCWYKEEFFFEME